MFKEGDVFVFTCMPYEPAWENKKFLFKNNFNHVLLETVTIYDSNGFIINVHRKGKTVFISEFMLINSKAKLFKEKKNHLPKWF